jgi:NTP pyrophosphatase (non-canonical NTP hydrolase)
MSIKPYQDQIDEMLKEYKKPYWEPLSQLARLTEEIGEVARILNHLYGDKPKKTEEQDQDLGEELGDVVYAVMVLANSQGIDLDPHIKKAINKLPTRDKHRFEKK